MSDNQNKIYLLNDELTMVEGQIEMYADVGDIECVEHFVDEQTRIKQEIKELTS